MDNPDRAQSQNPEEALPLTAVLIPLVMRCAMSLGEIAKVSHVPKQTLHNWMSGKVTRPHSWSNVLKLAAVLTRDVKEADALLAAAGFPPVRLLRAKLRDVDGQVALRLWHLAQHGGERGGSLAGILDTLSQLLALRDITGAQRFITAMRATSLARARSPPRKRRHR